MSFTIIVNSWEKWGEQINPTSYPKLFWPDKTFCNFLWKFMVSYVIVNLIIYTSMPKQTQNTQLVTIKFLMLSTSPDLCLHNFMLDEIHTWNYFT